MENTTKLDTTKDVVSKLQELKIKQVYFRYGIWNSFELKDIKTVLKSVNRSEYGEELEVDNDNYYITCPSASDKW